MDFPSGGKIILYKLLTSWRFPPGWLFIVVVYSNHSWLFDTFHINPFMGDYLTNNATLQNK